MTNPNWLPILWRSLTWIRIEQGLIRQGHQRVLTARFRDAEFFWNADQKIPLRDRIPLLDQGYLPGPAWKLWR
jgi:hypothetical protein